jgi:hypothetical protein
LGRRFPHILSVALLSFRGVASSSFFVPRRGGKEADLEQFVRLVVVWWWWLVGAMSFVFRGSRGDIEAGGFPGFAPERRAMVSVSA